jgi:Zn-dependent protease
MRSPFTWSISLGSLFGIAIRVHILFPFIAFALVLRAVFHPGTEKPYPDGTAVDVMLLMLLLFVSVLLHEWGHCLGARLVEGDAHEILLWPLGGLAPLEVPHRPRAHFIAAAAGPLTSLLVALVAALGVLWFSGGEARPPWNPFWAAFRVADGDKVLFAKLFTWSGDPYIGDGLEQLSPLVLMARIFWINWVLFLANLVIVAFPLDGGRLFQCALWPWYGFRQATLAAIIMGFVMMLIVAIVGLAFNEIFVLFLALILFATCQQQWILLETGGEESVFGYDFSQGYTSLESELPAPRRKRPNIWQRWRQSRAQRKQQREQEIREAEERRMDELLEKVQREGLPSLTEEERRFLKRVSDRYRHR